MGSTGRWSRPVVGFGFALAFLVGSACAPGPASLADICLSFEDLVAQMDADHGVAFVDGEMNEAVDALAGSIARYSGDEDLALAGQQLAEVAKGNDLSEPSIRTAAMQVQSVCHGTGEFDESAQGPGS